MTEIVITPPEVITVTATSPTAYTITVIQPAAVTVSVALGASGTVTSIATTAPITGGTITGTGTIGISAATTAAAGSMSASDKTKLDGIEAGAEVNNISDVNATDLTDGGATTLHTHASPALVTPSVADNFVSFSNTTGAQKDSGKGLTHLVYTLQFGAYTSGTLADSSSLYIGGAGITNSDASESRIYFPMAGTVVYADFINFVNGVLGTAENAIVYFRLNDTTNTLISNTLKSNAVINRVQADLSIAVTTSDYFEILLANPVYATNPTVTRQWGVIMVRV